MKRFIVALVSVSICALIAATAMADTIDCNLGPFTFTLPADANSESVSLYGADMEIAGYDDGSPYRMSMSFTSMDLSTAEAWETVMQGQDTLTGGMTIAESLISETLYSVDYRIVQKDERYTGMLSAGCAIGYMSILCTFAQPEYAFYETLLASIRDTLVYDPSIVADKAVYVWIAGPNGTKYHNSPTCCGMKNPVKITLEEAIRRGLQPCKICH